MAEKKIEKKKVEHKSIYQALSGFQGDLKPIKKNATVDFKTKSGEVVNFKYSPLGDIMEVVNPLLGKHGLSVRWEIVNAGKGLECVVVHETTDDKLETVKVSAVKGETGSHENEEKDIIVYGEVRSGAIPVDMTNSDMKQVGAQITYSRRYSLGLALGIATEEDTDARLLEDKVQRVQSLATGQAKSAIEKASTVEEVEKGLTVLKRELEKAQKGEKTAFGLEVSQYEELVKMGEDKKSKLEGKQEEAPEEETVQTEEKVDKKGNAGASK